MFFTGDPVRRRKVDLSGRVVKEDRESVIEKSRKERERRQRTKLENQSATRIQRAFRGRRSAKHSKWKIGIEFKSTYGEFGEFLTLKDLMPDSNCLAQIIFFGGSSADHDIRIVANASRVFLSTSSDEGSRQTFLHHFRSNGSIMQHRMPRFALLLLQSLENVGKFRRENHYSNDDISDIQAALITVVQLYYPFCPMFQFLVSHGLFKLLAEIMRLQVEGVDAMAAKICLTFFSLPKPPQSQTAAENTFSVQIGSIPFLWDRFPAFKQTVQASELWRHMVDDLLPVCQADMAVKWPQSSDRSLPPALCVLANLIEGARLSAAHLTQQSFHFAQTAASFVAELNFLFPIVPCWPAEPTDMNATVRFLLPSLYSESAMDFDESSPTLHDIHGQNGNNPPSPALQDKVEMIADSEVLMYLSDYSLQQGTGMSEMAAREVLNGTCTVLVKALTVLPRLRYKLLFSLAWRTHFLPNVWMQINRWLSDGRADGLRLKELPHWMLPLAVFCPAFSCVLITIENDEFHQGRGPLSLDHLPVIIRVLKEVIWDILGPGNMDGKRGTNNNGFPQAILGEKNLRTHVSLVASRLLSQLYNRNCQKQLVDPVLFQLTNANLAPSLSQISQDGKKPHRIWQLAPFLLPFHFRVQLYDKLLRDLKDDKDEWNHSPSTSISIRRDFFVEDSFSQLHNLPSESWRQRIKVTYVNEFGETEAGIDGGGILKDFLENITKKIFHANWGLFKETNEHLLYPGRPSELAVPNSLQYFEFAGKILGKAMYEGILLDLRFATFFLNKLLNKRNTLDDLPSLDAELYRNLLFLKGYSGDFRDLALSFAVEENELGEVRQMELVPGGRNISVSRDNVVHYIWEVADHHLNTQISKQSTHFIRGFFSIIPARLIVMFSSEELQMLISGSNETVDLNDLQQNCIYSGGYDASHPVITRFWKVLAAMDLNLQHLFLKFVTGCSRGPLMGFKDLEPKFCIHRAVSTDSDSDATQRLPTSATCMNLLKLPPYMSQKSMREKLTYAITSGAGFDLS